MATIDCQLGIRTSCTVDLLLRGAMVKKNDPHHPMMEQKTKKYKRIA